MHQSEPLSTKPEAAGLLIHGAARYDLLVWLLTLGGEKRLRQRMLRLARLKPGDDVLDIGCGTGSLAILAKRQVGGEGSVKGIDASPEMIERARAKARRAGADVLFTEGAVQALPLADASVDVVLSTLMLHHVPRTALPAVAREIRRVLRPGGRLLIVDFTKPAAGERSFVDRFHRHGFIRLDAVVAELEGAGFTNIRGGPLGQKSLNFVLASHGPAADAAFDEIEQEERGHGRKLLIAAGIAAALVVVALHVGAALSLRELVSSPVSYAVAASLGLLLAVKIGLLGLAHRFGAGPLSAWLGGHKRKGDEK